MKEFLGLITADGITATVALLSLIVAVIAISSSRNTAKKNNSLSLLMDLKQDDLFYKTVDGIKKISSQTVYRIEDLATENTPDQGASQDVRFLLNLFEAISVGIKHGIYAEAPIKDSICTILISTYDKTKPFMDKTRQLHHKDTYFMEMERLANRWKKSPIKADAECRKWWGIW